MLDTFYMSVFFKTLSNFIVVTCWKEISLSLVWANGNSARKSHKARKFRVGVYVSFGQKALKIQ